jgi:hypothetical protein
MSYVIHITRYPRVLEDYCDANWIHDASTWSIIIYLYNLFKVPCDDTFTDNIVVYVKLILAHIWFAFGCIHEPRRDISVHNSTSNINSLLLLSA